MEKLKLYGIALLTAIIVNNIISIIIVNLLHAGMAKVDAIALALLFIEGIALLPTNR